MWKKKDWRINPVRVMGAIDCRKEEISLTSPENTPMDAKMLAILPNLRIHAVYGFRAGCSEQFFPEVGEYGPIDSQGARSSAPQALTTALKLPSLAQVLPVAPSTSVL